MTHARGSRGWRRLLGAACLVWMSSAGHAAQTVATLDPMSMAARLQACTACHGAQGRAGPDGYYPRIAGKPREYLYNQLVNFRDGRRAYQPMQHLLQHLSDDYLRDMAAWFADQHPPYDTPATPRLSAAQMQRGQMLATQGDPSRKVPACTACHAASLTGMEPAIPGLLGLPHDYISSQFGAWTNGLRRSAAPDCMAQIAKLLTPEDISAVAGWLASQAPGSATPQPASAEPLPMACGTQAPAGARP